MQKEKESWRLTIENEKRIAVEAVRENTMSISEAAKLANLGVEMMDLFVKNGVKSHLTTEDVEEDSRVAQEIV